MILVVTLAVIGMLIGIWVIKRGARKAQASGYTRDRVEVSDTPVVRAAIDAWAKSHGYQRAKASVVLYQKNVQGRRGQPTFLNVREGDGILTLESYIGLINPITRKLQAGEMALGARGMTLAVPRKAGKLEHNRLREELGLPAID